MQNVNQPVLQLKKSTVAKINTNIERLKGPGRSKTIDVWGKSACVSTE